MDQQRWQPQCLPDSPGWWLLLCAGQDWVTANLSYEDCLPVKFKHSGLTVLKLSQKVERVPQHLPHFADEEIEACRGMAGLGSFCELKASIF